MSTVQRNEAVDVRVFSPTKPHISRLRGTHHWTCCCDVVCGVGQTPSDSFRQWLRGLKHIKEQSCA